MAANNKEIVGKVNTAFAENNIEGFLSFCADDVQWTMVGDKAVKGKDAIRSWMASMITAEAPKFTVDNVVAEGDCVVAYGDLLMKEEGKLTPFAYCDVYRFQGNRIVELRSFVVKTGVSGTSQTSGTAA